MRGLLSHVQGKGDLALRKAVDDLHGQSTVKKAHLRAPKLSKVAPFVLYDLRHTCLTRWAQYLDAFTLKKLAGHESLSTTMKYVHLNERDSDLRLNEAREKIELERGGHKIGTMPIPLLTPFREKLASPRKKRICGAPGGA